MRLRSIAVAALAVALTFAPAKAQEMCFDLAATIVQLSNDGSHYAVLDGSDKDAFVSDLAAAYGAKTGSTAEIVPGVTHVLLANMGGLVYFGVVIDGCLTAPALVTDFVLPDAVGKWVGKPALNS